MVTKHLISLVGLACCLAFLFLGCGASKAAKQKEAIIETQRPVIVEKSGKDKRPEWASEKPFAEDENGFLFSGGFMGGADYALTLRLAKAEATKNLLESIEIKARGEFSSVIQGQDRTGTDLGRYVTDAVAWTVDSLRVPIHRPSSQMA